jgi:hypothetical protein
MYVESPHSFKPQLFEKEYVCSKFGTSFLYLGKPRNADVIESPRERKEYREV